MAEIEQPQIYLITPAEFDLSSFPTRLSAVLDAHEISCVRLSLATRDEDRISRAADALREITLIRDVALVIDTHIQMVERLGLDGIHLTDGARSVRKTRKALGPEAIIGSYCAASNHEGMAAAEAGADYVCFGPVVATELGDGTVAEPDLFKWWSEMIEVPVVAEGGLTPDMIRTLAPMTDFFGIGDEIWAQQDAAAALSKLKKFFG